MTNFLTSCSYGAHCNNLHCNKNHDACYLVGKNQQCYLQTCRSRNPNDECKFGSHCTLKSCEKNTYRMF